MQNSSGQTRSGMPVPEEVTPDLALLGERFPKIVENIRQLWGSSALQEYFGKTIFDERGGRQGFPVPVVMALERIAENHSKLFPQQASDPFWDGMSH